MNAVNMMEASHQWAKRPADERFQTLAALRESVHARRMVSRSTDVTLSSLNVRMDGGGLVINSGVSECEPTHWSFGQLASAIGAPGGYLRTLSPKLLTDCFNEGLAQAESPAKIMVASREEGPGNLQAVTSTTYGRIWDADCVDAVTRIQERTSGRFYNPPAYVKGGTGTEPSGLYASDHDCFMFLIDGGSRLEVGPRAKLNRGFIMSNSETGARTMTLMTFLFNEVCGNHIIWGAQEVNKLVIRHTAGGPYRFDAEAAPLLLAYAEDSALPVESVIRKAQAFALPDNGAKRDTLNEWFKSNGKFSNSEVRGGIEAAFAEEGQCATLWDAVQGLTAYARGFDHVDARVELERRAGALLNIVSGN